MGKDYQISTKAIDEIINNPSKLSKFTTTPREMMSDDDYIDMIAYRSFTLSRLDEKNKIRFARFNELNEKTTADFAYLCNMLATTTVFRNHDFKVNPILELYEDLLRENWEIVKKERDTLNAIDAFEKTPKSNIQICKAICSFLKQYVLTNQINLNNNI